MEFTVQDTMSVGTGRLRTDSFTIADGGVGQAQIAQAIADGVKLHAQAHPEDANRKVDGVVANQCLMASLGFAEGYYIRSSKRPVGSGGIAACATRANVFPNYTKDPKRPRCRD